MRVVLDTNILISALISPSGPPDIIYRAWRSGQFELVTSVTQLEEMRRASRYPKMKSRFQSSVAGAMVNHLRRAVVLDQLKLDKDIADPNDAYLLAMAATAEADYLVTGDRRAGLLQSGSFNRTRIVTPSRFCDEVL